MSTGNAWRAAISAAELFASVVPQSSPELRALWNLGVLCNLQTFALLSLNLALKALVPQQLNLMLDWFLNCHLQPAHGSSTAELLACG